MLSVTRSHIRLRRNSLERSFSPNYIHPTLYFTMSSSEDSDGTDMNFECEVEPESDAVDHDSTPSMSDNEAFGDEPLADAEWTAQYEREMEKERELEKELTERLQGRRIVSEW